MAPDIGPPGTGGDGSQDGAFFGAGLLVRGLGSHPEFAVDFMLVGVGQELIHELVGSLEFQNAVGGEEGGEAFLPVVVAAFDFAFGLRGGGAAQGDAVEVEGGPELGEGVGAVGVEEGVEVHVENEREAVGLEGAGEEVQMGQEGFTFVEACPDVVAGGVVDEFQQGLFVVLAGGQAWGLASYCQSAPSSRACQRLTDLRAGL